MKGLILSALFLVLRFSLFAGRLAILPGIMEPYSIAVDEKHVYIGEESSVSIYTLTDFKLVKKFGSRGEGPMEFKSIPFLEVFPEYLIVNCFGKLLFFEKNGTYIKEIRTPSVFTLFVYPVGDNYVGLTVKSNNISREKSFAIDLFDRGMKFLEEIAKEVKKTKETKSGRRQLNAIVECFKHNVFGDHIYIADSQKGFHIEVFDSRGKKCYVIDKDYEKIRVTEEYRNAFNKRMNNSKDYVSKITKSRYSYAFPDYFPAIKEFMVKNGKIYAFTYKQVGGKREVIVMDLKGKVLKKSFVTAIDTTLEAIAQDRYYYLLENEEKEVFELFAEEI